MFDPIARPHPVGYNPANVDAGRQQHGRVDGLSFDESDSRTHVMRLAWFPPLVILALSCSTLLSRRDAHAAEPVKPLKALLITGGCCHEYGKQKDLLKQGIEARAQVAVEQVHTDDTTDMARFTIYEDKDWAKGYDVVIHDECSSNVTELAYVENILAPHKGGVPAVNLHCAMHCYRTGKDDWFKFVGVQSTAHGPQLPIAIRFVDLNHPITKVLDGWTTINEELYNNIRVLDSATALARGKQTSKEVNDDYVVAWVNDYGKTRVFSTTLGHNSATVGDGRYLDLVTRGLLWSCDKLNDEYLKETE
jgi:type 1 glutamine amidotransferase